MNIEIDDNDDDDDWFDLFIFKQTGGKALILGSCLICIWLSWW